MKKALIAVFLGLCAASQLYAAATPQEAWDEYATQLSGMYKTLSVFMSNNFQKSAGFMSGAHAFAPPAARKKFGFNVGLMGGATFTQMDKKSALTGLASPGLVSFVNGMPELIPMGQGGFNLHYGLPSFLTFESFDIGLRTMVFNGEVEPGKNLLIGTELRDYGLDASGNVFEEGLAPLTLRLGLSVDSMKGKVWIKMPNTVLNDSSTVPGYTATGTVSNEFDMEMNNLSYQLKAIASRKFIFFRPYLGVAAQVNSGSADSRGFQSGLMTMTGGGSYSSAKEIEGKASAPVNALDLRFGGGFELDFKVAYLSLNGEYGAVSGGSGVNLQVGGKFR